MRPADPRRSPALSKLEALTDRGALQSSVRKGKIARLGHVDGCDPVRDVEPEEQHIADVVHVFGAYVSALHVEVRAAGVG